MEIKEHFIKDFRNDSGLGDGLSLLLSVKSFKLDEIRKRYLASKKNKNGKAGSVERREPAVGGIIKLKISKGEIQEFNIIRELPEPRGIAKNEKYFAFSSENKVIVQTEGKEFEIENEWFSYIHALNFSPFDSDKLLISSSGLDCIFEYDLRKKEKTWEWFAWEHYSNEANDPVNNGVIFLTRNESEYNRLRAKGLRAKLVRSDEYLPTAMRAAFINSVSYSWKHEGEIIATLFHEGKSISINKKSNKCKEHIADLSNPHGGWEFKEKSLITSTSSGKVFIQRKAEKHIFNFAGLPNKHSEMGEKEWLQNSILFGENIITIDSNRTSFVIFNPSQKTYNQIAYPDHWAVQDLVEKALFSDSKKGLV